MKFTESEVESAALAWLESLDWRIKHGPEIAPGEPFAERDDYREAILPQRLKDALTQLNPELPIEALDEAFRKLVNPPGATLEARNRAFHRMLVDGVTVEYRREDGSIAGAQARVIDFDDPENNDFLAVNQFTVTEGRHTRRPDIVLFVNGLPLVIIELKNPADEEATIWTAYQQLQTYKAELPTLFAFNELLVISDGLEARMGTLTAGREWFKPWRTISGERVEDEGVPQLEVLLKGVFEPGRFLELIRDFMVYEDDGGRLTKKVAGYHQFHAVRVAVRETLRAAALTQDESLRVREEIGRYEVRSQGGRPGDRRIGVVWHTQGSGKSLTMLFYAGRIIREPAMQNPTVVVLTDRNDLDDQLFGVFPAAKNFYARSLFRPKAGPTCGSFFHEKPEVSSSLPFKSSFLTRKATVIPYFLSDATLWSWPTKLIAVSTISLTVLPAIFVMPYPTPLLLLSREHRLSLRIATRELSLATTSPFTISSEP